MIPDDQPSPQTSRANPGELQGYASTGLDMLTTLRTRQQALHAALESLRPFAGSEYVPSLEGVDNQLDRLILDWQHLDTFVGDVGQAFIDACTPGQADELAAGLPIRLSNSRLADHGQVGFADRGEAIEAGEEAAEQLAELSSHVGYDGVDPEQLEEIYETIAVGQHDPAFAVAFSESLGAEGYVEAVTAIRAAYLEDVPEEGLGHVQVLATTLTTALDTRPGIPAADRHDPDNAHLTIDQRLSGDFVDDLIGADLQPTDSLHFEPSTQDLSLLMSMTDPPTDVAVAVANAQVSPLLENDGPWEEIGHLQPWGDRGDVVSNYATMLGRNPDASIRWLDSSPQGDTRNLELVLQREGDADADGGEALARVVENGLTHPDQDSRRERLMEVAIETVGDEGEIHNPHMEEALARGVEHNMDVVDRMVNGAWRDPQEVDDLPDDGTPEVPGDVRTVEVVLREVMRDEDAAVVVSGAVEDHMLERLGELPGRGPDADGDGADDRTEGLRDMGTLHGVVVAAEVDLELGSIEDYLARKEALADGGNALVGLLPYAGELNDLADVGGVSVGELGVNLGDDLLGQGIDMDDLTEAQQAALLGSDVDSAVLLALAEHPERAEPAVGDLSPEEREELYRWATSPGAYDGADHDSLSMATVRVVATLLLNR